MATTAEEEEKKRGGLNLGFDANANKTAMYVAGAQAANPQVPSPQANQTDMYIRGAQASNPPPAPKPSPMAMPPAMDPGAMLVKPSYPAPQVAPQAPQQAPAIPAPVKTTGFDPSYASQTAMYVAGAQANAAPPARNIGMPGMDVPQAGVAQQVSNKLMNPPQSAPPQYAGRPQVAQPQPQATGPMDPATVADRQTASDLWSGFKSSNQRAGAAIADVATLPLRGVVGAYDSAVVRPMRAAGINASYLSPNLAPNGANVDSMTPFYDQIRSRDAATQPTATQSPRAPSQTTTDPSNLTGVRMNATTDPRSLLNPSRATAPVNTGVAPDGSPLMSDPMKGQDVGNGIRRIDSPGKSPLFTNVANEPDNAALMNRGQVSAQNQSAAQNLSDRYAAERGATAAKSQYDAEVADAARVNAMPIAKDTGGFGILSKDYRDERSASFSPAGKKAYDAKMLQQGHDQASIEVAAGQNDASRSRDAAAIQRTGIEQQGATARFGMTNQIEQQRSAREQAKFGFDAQAATQVQDAQKALLSAKTPEDRQAAMETLAGLQGKYSPKESKGWKGIALQGSTDAMGNKSEGVLAAINEGTGEIRERGGAQKVSSTPTPASIAKLKANPAMATKFDEMFGAGASAAALK